MKKISKLVIMFLTVLFTMTSCDSSPISSSVHEHKFASFWVTNDEYHWHPSTCGHDVKGDEGRHEFTSETNETGDTVYTCSICHYSYSDGNNDDKETYTVTWKNYDESILEVDSNVPYGTMPTYDGATPIKESDDGYKYYFAGWTPELEPVSKDATYTATFSNEEITYTIDFDLNGGTSSSYKGPIEVTTFSKDIFFFDCVKEDWQFRGWEYNNEKIFDEKGNQLKNVTLVDNMVFKAIYAQTVKLTITTNMPEAGTITGEGEYPYNTYVDVSATPNQGYKFVGWYYQNTLLSNEEAYKYMMWDKDVTLEARFEKDDFNLRIYSNNEDYGLVLLKDENYLNYLPEYNRLKEYTSEVTIAAYSKSDVRFLGWYDENNNLVTTNAVYTFVMPNYDYTLEAKWNYFTINYNLNGGTNDPNNPSHYTIDNAVYLQNPTKVGYEFIGWEYNGEIIDTIDVNLMQDVALEAVWSPYEYEIKEDDNGKYASIIGFDETITVVVIPETVTLNGEKIPVKEINQNAFKGNQNVKSIIVSNKVTTIDENAFGGCSSLESIYLPISVTTIGSNAFKGCSLITIYSEASSKPDGWSNDFNPLYRPVVWNNNSQYYGDLNGLIYTICQDELNNKYIEIVKYIGNNTYLVIPETINVDGEALAVKSLSENAFYNNDTIIYTSIPNSVLKIGNNAFRNCINLKEITISETSQLTKIGSRAFEGCKLLNNISLPSTVNEIGSYALSDCSSLTSIFIPSSVATIGDYVFRNCSNLTIYCEVDSKQEGWSNCWNNSNCPVIWNSYKGIYGNFNDFEYIAYYDTEGNSYIVITEYNGSNTNVVIPEYIEVNGEQIVVKEINDKAFYNNKTIRLVTIHDSVTTIGEYAFYNCSNLETVTISENSQLTSIGSYAFYGCSSLTSIYIPDSVTSIGDYVFRNCSNLKTVTISENSQLTSIGSYAFYGCSSLATIYIPNSVTNIGEDAFRNCSILTIYCGASSKSSGWISSWNYSDRPVVWNCIDYGITVEGIHYAVLIDEDGNKYIIIGGYSGSNTNVAIPEYIEVNGEQIIVKEINDKAFYNNETIRSVTIPDSVTTIGEDAFYNCSNLETVTISENSQLTSIGSYAFYNCSSLTSIYIPDSVTSIGDYVFRNCSNLKTVTISENSQLTSIGIFAFCNCSSLTSIYIPSSVTTIRDYAFENCSILTIYCEASSKSSGWVSTWNFSNRPVVWNCINYGITVEGIHYAVLIDEDGNKYIIIEGYSGSNTNVVIPEYIEVNGENIIVKEINDKAFYNNKTIRSVTIPDSVTTIGSYAFYNCSNLETVTISENSQLTSIGSYAFYGCSSLTSIYIPDSVTSIGGRAFFNCSNLATVTIGENSELTTIGLYAFYNCSSLTSIYIPSSVTTIREYAFENCSILTIYCEASSKSSGWISSWNPSGRPVVWNCIDYGITVEGIHYGVLIDEDGNKYIIIGGYNGSNTNVVIPEYIEVNREQIIVKEINDKAFHNNETIRSVTIPDSVTTIGEYAFYNCSNLKTVTISENSQLTSIGPSAFSNCSSLTSIYIPDSVTTIGFSAFSNCSNLKTVTISENSKLTSIGTFAFANCSSLTSIYIPESVTKINSSAFEDCSNLTTVNIGENSRLETIGSNAFSDCSSLTSIYIPNSVTAIGEYAFSNCSSLTSIYIPNSVTTISFYAFEYCTNLTIYCEVSYKPSGWVSSWNYSDRPVVWNYTYDEYLEGIA